MDFLNIIFAASLGLQIVHGAKAEMVESMDLVFKFCSVPHHLDTVLRNLGFSTAYFLWLL